MIVYRPEKVKCLFVDVCDGCLSARALYVYDRGEFKRDFSHVDRGNGIRSQALRMRAGRAILNRHQRDCRVGW